METRKTKLGADHPDMLSSMAHLAYTLESLGRRCEALDLMDSCASLRGRVISSQHPDTNASKNAIDLWEQNS